MIQNKSIGEEIKFNWVYLDFMQGSIRYSHNEVKFGASHKNNFNLLIVQVQISS